MTARPTDPFLAGLRDSGLLAPDRLAELTAFADAANPDDAGLAKEVHRRGWLTSYQIKEIYHGRGKGLALGPYVLLELLGEGGMGRVFKAHHTRLGRDVAIKLIRKEKLSKPAVVQRFQQEIWAAAKLSHPNVVLAFDANEVDGVHFYAMEHVEGSDLTKVVRDRGPLPVPAACDYVRQAAVGLQHAHEQGLVHRDVKPSNLLVTPKGQVKVLDLGLAMLNSAPVTGDANRVTQEGLVIGTPDFLAPEQAQNPLAVDTRADVYALGATLFYLLTGRVPFEGETPTAKLIQHVTAPPPPLRPFRPDAPPQLEAVIWWMMAKRPEDRPQTPAQAAAALAPFCHPTSGVVSIPAAVVHPVLPTPVRVAPPTAEALPRPEALAFDPEPAPRIAVRAPAPRRSAGGFPLKLVLALGAAGALAGVVAVVGYVGYSAVAGPAAAPDGFTNSVGMTMVRVPGGSFPMGSAPGEPGRDADEGPAGEVTVSGPFLVSAHEVTYGQMTAVLGKTSAKWPQKMRKPNDTPVDGVTWDEAVEFCRKLTAKERDRASRWAYRLPTEAEWEYACRGGTRTPFWGGDKLLLGRHGFFRLDPDKADELGDGDPARPRVEQGLPHPVGAAEPNPFGLHDVHGNVWEWCGDYHADDYPGRGATDPRGPETGDWRVLRGGSWKEPAARCRSAARRGMAPTQRQDDVGFRVVYAPVK